MLTLIVLAEWAGTLGFAWALLRRRPPASPRAVGRTALSCVALLLAQTALFFAIPAVVGWLFEGGTLIASRTAAAGAAIWLVQAVRAALLLYAFALWLDFAYADSPPRRFSLRAPAVLLAVAALIELPQGAKTETSGAVVLGLFLVMLLLVPKTWMASVRGRRRAAAVPLALLAVLFAQDMVITRFGAHPGTTIPGIGAGQLPLLGDGGAEALAFYERAAAPFTTWTRMVLNVLAPAALVALLRLPFPSRVLPSITLRGVSLRRRFALTYVLIRVLPQLIAMAVLAAALYFMLGMRATGRVRESLEATLQLAQHAADATLRDVADADLAERGGRAARSLEMARSWMGPDSARTFVVVRDVARASLHVETAADSILARMGIARVAFERARGAATVGAPDALLSIVGAGIETDRDWRGLVEADGALYLMAQRSRAFTADENSRSPRAPAAAHADSLTAHATGAAQIDSPTAPVIRVAQVFVAVDSLLASRIARDARASFVLEAKPNTYVVRDAKHLAMQQGDVPWTAASIRLRAEDPADSAGAGAGASAGLLDARRYFAKDLLAIGDWTQPLRERGAVLLRLETSLARVLSALSGAIIPALLTIGTPFVLLAIAGLLITEGLAVRVGRGIASSILGDVKTLSQAARRIGEGDLEHRVPVEGKDELAGLASAFNEMTANLKRHQQELLEKERLEADVAVARDIQRKLLPQSPPSVRGLDVAGVSIPSLEVGGDLFCFLTLEGGRLGAALGDVSGKSVPAALLMSNVLASLKAHAQHGVAVHASLEHINRLLCEDILFGKFVTLFFGMIDPRAGEIRYACAGHNPPLVVSASGEVRWLRDAWVPLGIMPEAEYKEAIAPLAAGDVLVIYSDGVTEAETVGQEVGRSDAPNGPATVRPSEGGADANRSEDDADASVSEDDDDAAMFGEERLAATVTALRAAPAAAIVEGIVDAVRNFARGAPQSDDLTIVVVKIAEGRPPSV